MAELANLSFNLEARLIGVETNESKNHTHKVISMNTNRTRTVERNITHQSPGSKKPAGKAISPDDEITTAGDFRHAEVPALNQSLDDRVPVEHRSAASAGAPKPVEDSFIEQMKDLLWRQLRIPRSVLDRDDNPIPELPPDHPLTLIVPLEQFVVFA